MTGNAYHAKRESECDSSCMRNVESFKAAYVGSFRTVGLDLRGQEEKCQVPEPRAFSGQSTVGIPSVPIFQ